MTVGLILISFCLSLACVWLFRKASAGSPRLLDIPNERSSHSVPVTRGAGIAIVFTVLVTYLAVFGSSANLGYVLAGLLIAAVLIPLHARHRRPGLTLGLFMILYGAGRFVGELFREPDAGQPGFGDIPPILGFMSKGQAFTLPLFVVGGFLVWLALRRPRNPDLYAAKAR